jgi:hypothetical protein
MQIKIKKVILRSTGQTVLPMPWKAKAECPWDDEHERIIIPGEHNRVEVVRKVKLAVVKKKVSLGQHLK